MSTDAAVGFVPEITVGWRIRIARETAGMDQKELAERTGIARNTISNYEKGATTHLKPLYLRQIALITGVDPGWLANGVPSSGDPSGLFRMGNATPRVFATNVYDAADRFRSQPRGGLRRTGTE